MKKLWYIALALLLAVSLPRTAHKGMGNPQN